MPAVRRTQQSASPVETSSLYALTTPDHPQFNSLSLSPISPDISDSPSPPAKKKRSHGKAKPAGHIPRPPNAFIIFRTNYIRNMARQNSTPEVSKNLGEMWRNMSPSDKEPWNELAEKAKVLHQLKYPGYKYKPVHPRDEFGNCIRKPRRPNRPRVKKVDQHDDVLDHLPGTFQWLEGKQGVEFPSSGLPSDASSVSSPPASPSPSPSTIAPSSSSYVVQRRPSSVPLVCPDDSFYVHPGPHSAHPCPPTGYISRRGNKRPSTSLDFMCAGLEHSEPYSFANNIIDMYLSPNDHSSWRPGHRRSISAPDFGSEIATNLTFPSHNVPQEANPLTPINPVFGNVFDRFSWNTPPASSINNTHSQNTPADYSAMQPFAALDHRQQGYISVEIPQPALTSTTSNLSATASPPISTPAASQFSSAPAILHPAPIATFDFAAFQDQISEFEFDAAAAQGRFLVNDHQLSVVGQKSQADANVGMFHCAANETFFTPAGDDPASANLGVVAAQEGAGAAVMAEQSSLDLGAALAHPAVEHAADLQGYQEGLSYTRIPSEITQPDTLGFNDLIVDGY